MFPKRPLKDRSSACKRAEEQGNIGIPKRIRKGHIGEIMDSKKGRLGQIGKGIDDMDSKSET